jgi:hypothetical protein
VKIPRTTGVNEYVIYYYYKSNVRDLSYIWGRLPFEDNWGLTLRSTMVLHNRITVAFSEVLTYHHVRFHSNKHSDINRLASCALSEISNVRTAADYEHLKLRQDADSKRATPSIVGVAVMLISRNELAVLHLVLWRSDLTRTDLCVQGPRVICKDGLIDVPMGPTCHSVTSPTIFPSRRNWILQRAVNTSIGTGDMVTKWQAFEQHSFLWTKCISA